MKKLSIEEKAKRYDEAVQRARQFMETPYLENSDDVVGYIFPELKESEDERIINRIKKAVEEYWSDEPLDEILAWLEAQGEQKPVDKIQLGKKYKCIASPRYSTFMMGEIYKPEDKFLCSLMNFCSDCFEPIEDEHKTADKVEPKFKAGDKIISTISNIPYYITEVCNGHYLTDVGCIIMFNAQDNFELVEQKPAWSEEDEAFYQRLEQIVCKVDIEAFQGDRDLHSWLKSLRPQNNLSWTNADESMFVNLVAFLEGIGGAPVNGVKKYAEWLKERYKYALPMPHWKPSELQIEVLNWCKPLWNEPKTKAVLESLIEDLKKLREE